MGLIKKLSMKRKAMEEKAYRAEAKRLLKKQKIEAIRKRRRENLQKIRESIERSKGIPERREARRARMEKFRKGLSGMAQKIEKSRGNGAFTTIGGARPSRRKRKVKIRYYAAPRRRKRKARVKYYAAPYI